MHLECTCADITLEKWQMLMQGATRTNKRKLNSLIKIHLPELYTGLSLNLCNPYNYFKTNTHWILVHSSTEYFIRK